MVKVSVSPSASLADNSAYSVEPAATDLFPIPDKTGELFPTSPFLSLSFSQEKNKTGNIINVNNVFNFIFMRFRG